MVLYSDALTDNALEVLRKAAFLNKKFDFRRLHGPAEPSSIMLLFVGAVAFAAFRRRRTVRWLLDVK